MLITVSLEAIGSILASAISGFALYFALRANKRADQHRSEEGRTWQVQRMMYVHQYLSAPHHANARRKLRNAYRAGDDYDPSQHDRIIDIVCVAYDQAGFILLKSEYIEPQDIETLLRSTWGYSIVELFEAVQYYEGERTEEHRLSLHDTSNFFFHFVALYKEAKERWPNKELLT